VSWGIERRDRVAVVTMNTNKVGAQNHEFFADLHEAFDTLEREHAHSAVVLTGQDGRFSAGLDLDRHFELFAGHRDAVAEWFAEYRATNMRLFTYPRPVVADVNGHAYARGPITAAVCDYRVCVDSGARFGLNEVPIGIPMPAVYVRMLAYAWGDQDGGPAAAGSASQKCTGTDPLCSWGQLPKERAGVRVRAADGAGSVSVEAVSRW
jgi:enoyl-CoA hydratase